MTSSMALRIRDFAFANLVDFAEANRSWSRSGFVTDSRRDRRASVTPRFLAGMPVVRPGDELIEPLGAGAIDSMMAVSGL